jgi:hypothetical protein
MWLTRTGRAFSGVCSGKVHAFALYPLKKIVFNSTFIYGVLFEAVSKFGVRQDQVFESGSNFCQNWGQRELLWRNQNN